MKPLFKTLIVCLLIAGAAFYLVSYVKNRNAEKQEVEAAVQRGFALDDAVSDFADSYGAVRDWRGELVEADLINPLMTLQIKKAVLREEPILLGATIIDIDEHDGLFTAAFSTEILDYLVPLYLRLSCSKELAERILQTPDLDVYGGVFALVVKPQDVSRATFRLAVSHNEETDSYPQIVVDTEASVTIVKGILLDFWYLGDAGWSIFRP